MIPTPSETPRNRSRNDARRLVHNRRLGSESSGHLHPDLWRFTRDDTGNGLPPSIVPCQNSASPAQYLLGTRRTTRSAVAGCLVSLSNGGDASARYGWTAGVKAAVRVARSWAWPSIGSCTPPIRTTGTSAGRWPSPAVWVRRCSAGSTGGPGKRGRRPVRRGRRAPSPPSTPTIRRAVWARPTPPARNFLPQPACCGA